jgi:CubicO group peptidase (beta-lactamase class C family)
MGRLLWAGVALALASGEAQAQPAAQLAPLHDVVARAIAAKAVPGAIVLVRQGGKLVFEEAQGSADGQPLKTDTVFWVASMTKPVVATTVMMMVEAGKVRLDDPVSKYVPEFAKPRQVRHLKPGSSLPPPGPAGAGAPPPQWDYAPIARPLTVRDIITMTGGLQTIRVPSAVPPVTATDTIATYVAKLGDAPLDFQPGTQWGYSNATEFEVAVRIVEVASGMGYADFVQKRVFDPIGMKDSHFGVREDLRSRLAPLGNIANNPISTGRFTSGSAGLWTTAEDYGRFAQMLLDGGVADGKRLLKAKTVKAMSTNEIGQVSLGGLTPGEYGGFPATTNPAVKYGYGLLVLVDPAGAGTAVPAGSFGWDGVGTRRFWVMPKTNSVLVMLVPSGQAEALHREIERTAAPLLAR